MTTTKIIAAFAAGAFALAPAAALAHEGTANEGGGGEHVGVSVHASARAGGNASSSVRIEAEDEDGNEIIEEASASDDIGSSSEGRGKSAEARGPGGMNASTSMERGEGESGEHTDVGEQHRSEVANIVHELLLDAARDGGIGAEVRAVASAQASSSERAAGAVAKLESESGFKKFFLGPSYKNLGELRSSVVTTENSIERLAAARERAGDAAVRADLDLQITALEEIASSTRAYVEQHADDFSLFGWLVRLAGF